MCADTTGAAKLLDVSRGTIYLWRLSGRLSQINVD